MAARKPAPKRPPPARADALAPSRRWRIHVLALFLLACAVYANTLAHGFVTDDNLQLLKNPLVTDFHHIPAIFSGSVAGFIGNTDNYYRPVHLLVYMFLYYLAGFNPFAYHLLIVLLHGLSTVLVYALVRRMAQPASVAVAAAAVFAVHPIHTEVVNWVAAVPDALLTPIVVFALWLFVRQGAAPRRLQIAAHGGLYLLALFTKEPGVMLLPLYAGYEWICLGRRLRDLRGNAALYAAMLAALGAYLACRLAALGSLAPAQQRFYRLTPPQFFLSATVLAARYFGKLVFPASLNYYYVFEPARAVSAAFLASLAVLAALAVIGLRWSRRNSPGSAPAPPTALAAFGIFWIAITLAPALNITGVGRSVFGERYLYLPSVGFALVAGLAWHWWERRARSTALAAGILILTVFAIQVVARNRDWHDNVTLLEKSIRQSPQGPELHSDLSNSYAERGQRDRAIAEARIAAALVPDDARFRMNLGNLLLSRNPRESIRIFQEMVRRQPSSPDAHYCLGLAWGAAGNMPEAAAEFQKALALQPAHSLAMLGLSGVYRETGRTREAIDLCLRAAAARPRDAQPQLKLAVLYLDSRQYADAARAAAEALRIEPDFDGAYLAHYCLGLAYGQSGSLQAALAEFASALRLNPQFGPARDAYQQALAAAAPAK